jgi:hypothetical protein
MDQQHLDAAGRLAKEQYAGALFWHISILA